MKIALGILSLSSAQVVLARAERVLLRGLGGTAVGSRVISMLRVDDARHLDEVTFT